eukprot:SAG11_NODE_3821_length_2207_cov_2.433586_3_plen_88_part_00
MTMAWGEIGNVRRHVDVHGHAAAIGQRARTGNDDRFMGGVQYKILMYILVLNLVRCFYSTALSTAPCVTVFFFFQIQGHCSAQSLHC